MEWQNKDERLPANVQNIDGQLVLNTIEYNGQIQCDLSFICVDRIDETGLTKCSKLNLHNAYFKDIDWTRLQNLKTLDLSDSKIIELCTVGLESLETLNISDTELFKLDTTHLTGLKCLIAFDTKLEYIDTAPLGNLETLKLANGKPGYDRFCAVDFEHLKKLRMLTVCAATLQNANCTCLPILEVLDITLGFFEFTLFEMPALRQLTLCEHPKTTDFSKFLNLEFVQLIGIQDFNATIYTQDRLKHLFCACANVNLTVCDLTCLESLGINGEQADTLNLTQLTNLRRLEVTRTMRQQIAFEAMTWLEQLKLEYTGVQRLNITNMKQLKVLDINEQDLILQIDDEMPVLRFLQLKTPKVQHLNTRLLPALKKLVLCETAVRQLDTAYLTELETLWLQDNKLESLQLWRLWNLRKLCVHGNQKQTINIKLFHLPSLKQLSIKHVQIGTLELLWLNKLRELELASLTINSADSNTFDAFVKLRIDSVAAKTATGSFKLDKTQPSKFNMFALRIAHYSAPILHSVVLQNTDIVKTWPNQRLHIFVSDNIVNIDIDAKHFPNAKIMCLHCQAQVNQVLNFRAINNLRQLTCVWTLEQVLDLSELRLLEQLDIILFYVQECDISQLVELKSLTIKSNRLQTLKLGSFTKLAYLYIQQANETINNAVDMSAFRELQVFDCQAKICGIIFGSHPLLRVLRLKKVTASCIHISGISELILLDIQQTEIEQITTKQHDKLLYLKISESSVRNLDASGMPNLRCLDISDTRITELDISCLEKLVYLRLDMVLRQFITGQHPKLQQLELSKTSISELDIRQMPNLAKLCLINTTIRDLNIGYCSSLVHLSIRNTPISWLDLNATPNLSVLEVHETDIRNLNVSQLVHATVLTTDADFICYDITLFLKLRELRCKKVWTNSFDVFAVPTLKALDVAETHVLFSRSKSYTHLVELVMHQLNKNALDMRLFPYLKTLDISSIQATHFDISQLQYLQVFKANQKLQNLQTGLHLSLHELDLSNTELLVFDISGMLNLTKLNISHSQIRMLRIGANCSIQTLDISQTLIAHLDWRNMLQLSYLYANGSQLRYCDVEKLNEFVELQFQNIDMRFLKLKQQRKVDLDSRIRFYDFRDQPDPYEQPPFMALGDDDV